MAEKAPRHEALGAEIRRLPDLSLAELRDRWKEVYGNPAPQSLRRSFLARAVAYQMQVEAYGGLSSSTKQRLQGIAATGERIRDKIAASKKKGMWMGGWVPLGYDRKDRTLVANEMEANTIRAIFDLFLKLKNLRHVQKELIRLNLRTKPYAVRRGRATGNLPFARGHIRQILLNPLYIGEINHQGVRYLGLHPALVSQVTWDAVQAQLAVNAHAKRSRRNAKSISLLAGLLYDATGSRLVSSHTSKNGKRYRYYVTPESHDRLPSNSRSIKARLPAAEIDNLVLSSMQNFLKDKRRISTILRTQRLRPSEISERLEVASQFADKLASDSTAEKPTIIADLVSRVVLLKAMIQIHIRLARLHADMQNASLKSSKMHADEALVSIEVPFSKDQAGANRLLIEERRDHQPDPVVVKAIARAYQWFDDLATGKARSMAEIATHENITDNYVSNLIHLAWLPPRVVELILDGHPQATMAVRGFMSSRRTESIWRDMVFSRG